MVSRDSPLWVMLELKAGKVPALLDMSAEFSCVRSDLTDYLYLMGSLMCLYVMFRDVFVCRWSTV